MTFVMGVVLLLGGFGAPEVSAAANANNAFAVDLYKQLSAGEGNLFFSPLSISSALAMAHAGAAGATADEMAKVLHLDGVSDAEFGALVRQMSAEKRFEDGGRLAVANALWLDKECKFLEPYTNTVRENFQAETFQVDFRKMAEEAREQINNWGKEKTFGRIPDLIAEGQVDFRTRLVLTNATYFRGRWSEEFLPSTTKDKPFHLTPQQDTTVPMMHQKEDLLYFKADTYQVVQLLYKSWAAMLIVLPDAVDGLGALEKKFTAEKFFKWRTLMKKEKVELTLPKFATSSEFDLKGELAKLGMSDAFQESAADFSRMTENEKVCISAVYHKAWLDVNEEGTEAVALTGLVDCDIGGVSNPRPPVIFSADHPFLYAIYDTQSGAILFLGRMLNPKA